MTPLRRALDWAFRNRITGKITIGQWPNLPLWLFIGLSGIGWVAGSAEPVGTVLRIAAGLALGWWAGDEILRGVNPWRRALGSVVLAGLAFTVLGAALGALRDR